MDTKATRNAFVKSLEEASKEKWTPVIELLQSRGIVFDEDKTLLGSVAIEFATPAIERCARSHGYTGGRLFEIGGWFPDYGAAVYAVYDTERMTYEIARQLLSAFVERQKRLQS